jgi:hypothetical protein
LRDMISAAHKDISGFFAVTMIFLLETSGRIIVD